MILGALTIGLVLSLSSCKSSQVEKEELIRPIGAELIFTEVVNVYVYKIPNPVDNIHLVLIRKDLKEFPQSIKDILVDHKYEIYFVSDFSDVSKNGNVNSNGKHDIENRLIMFTSTTLDPRKVFLHEVGHAFDYGNSSIEMQHSTIRMIERHIQKRRRALL